MNFLRWLFSTQKAEGQLFIVVLLFVYYQCKVALGKLLLDIVQENGFRFEIARGLR